MPMTLPTFDALVDAFFDKCKEVLKTKGADYTKKSSNRLADFEGRAQRRGMNPLLIIALFQDKPRDAIDSYITNGELESEPLEMRFVDDINFSLLMMAQAVAEGYKPCEDWLKFAVNTKGKLAEAKGTEPATPSEPSDADATQPSELRVVDFGKTGRACCNPEGDDCCDAPGE